jgi:hypothetical protein
MGDGALVESASVVDAVACAVGVRERTDATSCTPYSHFKLVDMRQSFMTYVDIDAAVAVALSADSDLRARQQVLQFGRPFHNGVLA